MLTKNAIGYLINCYKAVLKKCSILNTFGTLLLASSLTVGGLNSTLANAAGFTLEDGSTTTTEGSISLPDMYNPLTVKNNSTLIITGCLTTDSSTSSTINIGSSDSDGSIIVQGEDGVSLARSNLYIYNGSLEATSLSVANTYYTTYGITVGTGTTKGSINITGDATLSDGTTTIDYGDFTAESLTMSGQARFVLGDENTSTLLITGEEGIAIHDSASLSIQKGSAETTSLIVEAANPYSTTTSALVKIGTESSLQGASMTVSGIATFTDGGALYIGNGAFDVSNTGSLVVSESAAGIIIYDSGSLKANLSDFGSINNGVFTSGGTVEQVLMVASGGLVILGTESEVTEEITLDAYAQLLEDMRAVIFSNEYGTLALEGYSVTGIESLSSFGDQVAYYDPYAIMTAGLLDGAANITIAGTADGVSTISGSYTYLTLTGNGVDSVGSGFNVENYATLNLGSLLADNSTITVSGDINVTSGADLFINADSTVNGTVNISSDTIDDVDYTSGFYINSGASLTTEEIEIGAGSEFEMATQSQIDVKNLTIDDATITTNENIAITAESLTISDTTWYLESGTDLVVTGEDGFVVDGESIIYIKTGTTVYLSDLEISDDSRFYTGGASSESNGVKIIITGDYNIAPDGFATYTTTKGAICLQGYSTFDVQGELTFTASDSNSMQIGNTTAKVSADSITVEGDDGLMIRGTLLSRGDITSTGAVDLYYGSYSKLLLEAEDEASIDAAILLSSSSSLSINSGDWTAYQDITAYGTAEKGTVSIDGGSLTLATGVTLDLSLGILSLSDSEGSALDISSATLIAKLSNFGSLDLDVTVGSQFTFDSSTVLQTMTGNAATTLILTGLTTDTYTMVTADDYASLTDEMSLELFGSTGSIGSLIIYGVYVDSSIDSLSDVTSASSYAGATIGAGTYNITKSSTFGGISGTGGSIIDGSNVILTLTAAGEAEGYYSHGDITVQNAGTLYLGDATYAAVVDGGIINGSLTLTGSGSGTDYTSVYISSVDTTITGALTLESKGNVVYIRDGATLYADSISITKGDSNSSTVPRINLGEGIATDFGTGLGTGHIVITGEDGLSLNYGQVYIGEGGSITTTKLTSVGTSSTVLVGNANEDATELASLDVTGDISFTSGGSFRINNGDVTAENAVFECYYLYVGQYAESSLTLTGSKGLSIGIEGAASTQTSFVIYNGTVTTTAFEFEGGSTRIGADGAAGLLEITEDVTFNVSDIINVSYAEKYSSLQAVNELSKIALGVDGTLFGDKTFTLDTSDSDTLTTVGTVGGKDIVITDGNDASDLNIVGATLLSTGSISADTITVAAGTYEIVEDGADVTTSLDHRGGIELAKGTGSYEVNADIVMSDSTDFYVSGGAWTANGDITIEDGASFTIASGASFDVSSTTLTISNSATADISGATLTASITNFGGVDLNANSGSQFDTSTSYILADLVTSSTTTIILQGLSTVTMDDTDYLALIDELKLDIFGEDFEGTLSISDVTIGITSLSGILSEVYNDTDGTLNAGTYSYKGTSYLAGITGEGSSTISGASTVKLYLTGLGDTDGVLSEGDITVSSSAFLYLGTDASPDKTTIEGSLNASNSGKVYVNYIDLTVEDGVTVSNGSYVYLYNEAILHTPTLTITGDSSTYVNVGSSTDSSAYTGTLDVDGLASISGKSTLNVYKDASIGELYISGSSASVVVGPSSSASAVSATMTVENGITVEDGGLLGVYKGTLYTNELTLDSSSKVLIGTNSISSGAYLTILEDATFGAEQFTQYSTTGKIALGSKGEFNVDGTLTLDTSNQATMNFGGVLTAKGLTIVGDNALVFQSGKFYLYDDEDDTATQNISGDVTVAGASMTMAGDWVSDGDISVSSGSLTLASGASLDVTAGDLSLSADGSLDMTGASLTASLEDFGSLDITNMGNLFDDTAGTVLADLVGDDDSVLTLVSGESIILTEEQYSALIAELITDIFGVDSTVTITLDGYIIDGTTVIASLSDLLNATNTPEDTLTAGSLANGIVATLAGIAADGDETASTVSGSGTALTLTGLGYSSGILSKGDITVSDGATLTLGYNDGDLASPSETTFGGNITMEGTKLTVQNTNVTMAESSTLSITDGADVDILDGGLTTTNLLVDSDSTTTFYIGKKDSNTDAVGSLVADTITVDSTSATVIYVQNGSLTADTITLSGSDYTRIILGYANSSYGITSGTLIADTITLNDNTDLDIVEGSVTLTSLVLNGDNQVSIANSTASTSGVLTVNSDQTFDADKFASVKTDGKIAVYENGSFIVNGDLTLNTSEGANSLSTAGVVAAQGLNVSGTEALSVEGGVLALMDDGDADAVQSISGDVTVAGASMTVAGDWVSDGDVSVSSGALTLASGASLDVTAGSLSLSEGASLDMTGASLTASLADFGSVTLDGADGIFDDTAGTVLADLVGDGDSVLTLVSGESITLTEEEYDTLMAELSSDIFGDDYLGTIIIDGLIIQGVNSSLTDLKTLQVNPESTIATGTFTYVDAAGESTVYGGITGKETAYLNTDDTDLILTGAGEANGVLSEGSIDLQNGAWLTLGHADYADVSGTVYGDISLYGIGSGSSGSNDYTFLFVRYADVTVEGEISLSSNATRVIIGNDATLTVDSMSLSSATAEDWTGNYTVASVVIGAATTNYAAYGSGTLNVVGEEGVTLDNGQLWLASGEANITNIYATGTRDYVLVGFTGTTTLDLVVSGGIYFDSVIADSTSTGNPMLNAGFVIQNGTATVGEIVMNGTTRLDVGTLGTSSLVVTGDNGIVLTGPTGTNVDGVAYTMGFDINQGTANTKALSFDENVAVNVYDTGTLTIENDYAIAASAFGSEFDTLGKINIIGSGGSFVVEGDLTLYTAEDANSLSTLGTVAAQGLIVDGDVALSVEGGVLALNDDGDASVDQNISGDVTVAGGSMTVAGDWVSDGDVSVSSGSLTLASGASLDVTAGDLSLADGATLDMTGASLTASLSDFGTLDLDGTDGIFDDTTGTVLADLVGDGDSVLTLVSGESITLTQEQYDAFIAELAADIFGAESTVTITLDGYIIDDATGVVIGSLSDLVAGGDNDKSDTIIGAGELAENVVATVGGITGEDTTTNNGELTLTGAGDANGVLAKGDIDNSGTLVLGSEGTTSEMASTLTNSAEGVATTQGTTTLAEVVNEGSFNVEGEANVTSLTNSGTLTVTGTATVENFTAESDSGATVLVGNQESNGTLVSSSTKLSGTKLFMDPAWTGDDEITDASKASLSFTDKTVDGLLTVGQNSYLVLGDGSAAELSEAEEAFAKYGLTWGESEGDITAALFLNSAYTVDTDLGGIKIDGVLTTDDVAYASAGTATFAKQSLLAVNADNIASDTAALTASTITVDSGASLLVISSGLNYEDGLATVTVATATNGDDDALSIADNAWGYAGSEAEGFNSDTIYVDSVLMEVASVDLNGNTYTVTVSQVSGEVAYAGTKMSSSLAAHLTGYVRGSNSFLDKTTASTADTQEGAKANESAGKTAVASGVGASLGHIGSASVTNVQTRGGFSSAFNGSDTSNMLAMSGDGAILPVDKAQEGLGIWFMPMYKHIKADGFETDNYKYGYDTDLYGASLGADYTFASSLRLGLALHVGSGESDSTGELNSTANDFDYFGLTAYGSLDLGKLALFVDFGYTASSNDIYQTSSFGRLTAEADAKLISAGLKAEYGIALDSFNLTPYAGVRLNHYKIDRFDIKENGTTIVQNAASDYTMVEFPLGLTFDTTVEASGWDITPSLGLGVMFTAGERDMDQKVNYVGAVQPPAVFSSEVADAVTFQGALGLGMKKDAYSIDLGYTLDLSENVEGHGINLNLRYEF